MKTIEITGCNNCPFSEDMSCLLSFKLNHEYWPDVNNETVTGLRTDIPEECPIKLNEGIQINIKNNEN